MQDIEEIIAEARAEEEVERDLQKAAKEKKVKDDFKRELRESLKKTLVDLMDTEQTVRISLSEYISLVYMARDLGLIKEAIISSLELNYSEDDVRIRRDDDIINVLKILYPGEYKKVFNDIVKREG